MCSRPRADWCLAVGLLVAAVLAAGAVAATAPSPGQSEERRGTVTATVTVSGVTVSDVAVEDPDAVASAIASELDPLPESNVRVDGDGTVEVLTGRSTDVVADAVNRSGFDVTPRDVATGLREATTREVAADLEGRLRSVGSDPTVEADGTRLEVTVRNASLDAVAGRLRSERVAIYGYLPGQAGQTRIRLLDGATDLATVGEVRNESGTVSVPVRPTSSAASGLADALVDRGFTDQGVDRCRDRTAFGNYCLVTVVGEEVFSEAALSPDLADSVRSGEFEAAPELRVRVSDEQRAERLRDAASHPGPSVPLTVHSVVASDDGGEAADAGGAADDGGGTPGDSGAVDGSGTHAGGDETAGVSGFGGLPALAGVLAALAVGGLAAFALRYR